MALNFTTVDLSEPITLALDTVRLTAEAKAIQLEVLLNPTVGPIRGDTGRLQQVVWNLLSNAVKFTPPGGRVTIQLSQHDGQAQIQVSDTGKGIQPDFLPHVFELFQQQDSSMTRSFGGLGLGLAIARQVVEAHGGTITATSPGEGQGATFLVQFPLSTGPEPHTPAVPTPPTLGLEQVRIIAVDDEVDSLALVKVILEQAGAKVQAVSSATIALHELNQAPFDVLISDIGMPEMDGYAFIRQVRALSSSTHREIPAVAVTAYAGEANERHIRAAGFQAHLAKPIDPQQLLQTITTLLGLGNR
jgi:CheY-like chemotaxis protein